MSERKQRNAAYRRDAARQRAENARERAARQRRHGNEEIARVHERSANTQDHAADIAEGERRADTLIEGDQLAKESRTGQAKSRTA